MRISVKGGAALRKGGSNGIHINEFNYDISDSCFDKEITT